MLNEKLVDYLRISLQKNGSITALTDYKGEGFTYAEVEKQILRFHRYFREAGIRQGDKVALVGKNSAKWCISYLSVITYGAVIVPILPDFKAEDISHIINHSDSVILFCADNLYQELEQGKLTAIRTVFSLQNFGILFSADGHDADIIKGKEEQRSGENDTYPEVTNDMLAVISYTSGTTGFSKGVMLTHNSLTANIRFAQRNMPLSPGDAIVSFLPLAHAYGCAFEFLFPFSIGCQITILTKTPSPQVIIQAFKEIKPALVLSVPLVIEKIYKKQILPKISKPLLGTLLRVPLVNRFLLSAIRKKLTESFGGRFHEIVIGGAPFNAEAELFFRKMKFPYTVGYGMTECGPLISYAPWKKIRFGSSGKPVDTLEVRIDSPDPANIVGEIIMRGDNVMTGYYKNEKATREMIDQDGWLHSGDIGIMDKEGNIFIKGRSKSMILGASGQNIYPEELESMFNNKFAVAESLVVQREVKLVALIYPEQEVVKTNNLSQDSLEELFRQYVREINAVVPNYMQISRYEIHPEEFAKTPKRSIKRFLYK